MDSARTDALVGLGSLKHELDLLLVELLTQAPNPDIIKALQRRIRELHTSLQTYVTVFHEGLVTLSDLSL